MFYCLVYIFQCKHTRIRGKIKDKASEEGKEHARDDDINNEVQREPQHEEMVGDVQVGGVLAAGVVHPVLPATEILHHPFSAFHKVAQIWAVTVLSGNMNMMINIPIM